MQRRPWAPTLLWTGLLSLTIALRPAEADISMYVANVAFDETTNLENSLGIGLRWGRSSSILGGESSLLVARPERRFAGSVSAESATAIFFDGRFVVNVPTSSQVRPFVGVGLGRLITTSVEPSVPQDGEEALSQAMTAVADGQSNTTVSYGAGAHYAVGDKLGLRCDFRQYRVLSVATLAAQQMQSELGDSVGGDVAEAALEKIHVEDRTVKHNEISVGISLKF